MLVISGPSCVGKSLTLEILKKKYSYDTVVPYTCRKKRENETDGIEYYFLEMEKIIELKNKNIGYWDTPVNNNIYGYLSSDISLLINSELSVIQASVNIALQIKKEFHNAVLLFFDFQNDLELEKRIFERFGSKSYKNRINHAKLQREKIYEFDYVLKTDNPFEFISLLKEKSLLPVFSAV